MLTADQRRELEAIMAEMRIVQTGTPIIKDWADRISAVLANGVEE